MARCDSYFQHGLEYRCYALEHPAVCNCGGNQSKCDFFPEKRKQKGEDQMQTIKEIRQSTGLSQAKFCDLLNIPKRSLQDWEQGLRQCPEYVVELIAYRVKHDKAFPKVEK